MYYDSHMTLLANLLNSDASILLFLVHRVLRPFFVMLPAHFHDVTYDHFGKKRLQELAKSPARNTRAIVEH